MAMYRAQLPQLGDKLFLSDGGLETTLVFHRHIELPEFAAYDLLRSEQGSQILRDHYDLHAKLARRYQHGLILDTPTWRSNLDWGAKIGDTPQQLDGFNRQSVRMLEQVRQQCATADSPMVISGCLGPRGDGYTPSNCMSPEQAYDYHQTQIATFADTSADMVSAYTLNYVEEAIGISRAAQAQGMPVCISFTLETDGKLPGGESLRQAIETVDDASAGAPAYYMINCAHPTHFQHLLEQDEAWLQRLRGIKGNASCLSHAELDASEVLDEGNPMEFGRQSRELRMRSPWLTVLGGCCGTDHRHIEEICTAIAGRAPLVPSPVDGFIAETGMEPVYASPAGS